MNGMARVARLAVALAAPLSAAGLPVPAQAPCVDCHGDVSAAFPVRHAPAETGDCTSCHNPHVSRFESLLQERPATLCAQCHANVDAQLDQPHVHEPAAAGRCGDCHGPHGADHAGLLVKEGADLCQKCHDQVGTWIGRSEQHPPFDLGECSMCHQPHAAEHPNLSSQPGADLCTACHDVNASFQRAHRGYPVETTDCQQCHDPHASDAAGLFRANLHAPFEAGDCQACHSLPGGREPFKTRPLDELCGECHEEIVAEARNAPFPHLAGGGTGCADCHNPHAAEGEGLLKEPGRQLCLSCHDPGGGSSGQPGRFVSHADLNCTMCHSPHGGERGVLLVEHPIDLCGTCHSHQHAASHPQGEGTFDPRSGQPMSCVSCHGIHDSPFPKYLHLGGERDLCLSCHKELANR